MSLYECIVEWLATDEGRLAIDRAIKESDEAAAELMRSRAVDYDTLHRPMTI